MDAAEPQAAGAPDAGDTWCKWCGGRAALDGSGKVVHAASGSRTGGDGHYVTAVDREPPLWVAARRIQADYGGVFVLDARFGFLHASWSPAVARPGVTTVGYDADSEAGMRSKLDAALAMARRARR